MTANAAWVIVQDGSRPSLVEDFEQLRQALDSLTQKLQHATNVNGFQVRSFIRLADATQYVRNYNCYGSEDSDSDEEQRPTNGRGHGAALNGAANGFQTNATASGSGATTSATPSGPPPPYTQPNDHIPATPDIVLSDEQKAVLAEVQKGISIFFTGPAGVGKSVLLREIIKLFGPLPSEELAITASTGIAGVNIGGGTLHSFAGVGLGNLEKDILVKNILMKKKVKRRWRKVKTLIIDEVSMVDGVLFDKLEYIARKVRKNNLPFGGIQLVLSGDFFQLPPVPDKTHTFEGSATFAFDAKSWPSCISRVFVLKQVFRQRDEDFVAMLNAMRIGELTDEHNEHLKQLARPVHYDDGLEPCELFPIKAQVEDCNRKRLFAIESPGFTYKSMDKAGYDPHGHPVPFDSAKTLLDRVPAREELNLKVGAQVMLVKNIVPGTLVNGSLGKVVDFMTVAEARRRNIAIDQELNPMDAESRAQNVAAQQPAARVQRLKPMSEFVFERNQLWPHVRFENGSELLCAPLEFTSEGFRGNIEAHRLQVPLIVAYALSIHKSQGQTLSRVKVDFARIFEKGQGYVALSRATSLASLQVINFDRSKVQAHPRVRNWIQDMVEKEGITDLAMPSARKSAKLPATPNGRVLLKTSHSAPPTPAGASTSRMDVDSSFDEEMDSMDAIQAHWEFMA